MKLNTSNLVWSSTCTKLSPTVIIVNSRPLRENPYITSAHLRTFSDPPSTLRHCYWTSAKITIFRTPPTQSLCWRNIGMAPYLLSSSTRQCSQCCIWTIFCLINLMAFQCYQLHGLALTLDIWNMISRFLNSNYFFQFRL